MAPYALHRALSAVAAFWCFGLAVIAGAMLAIGWLPIAAINVFLAYNAAVLADRAWNRADTFLRVR